jgi:hypothetical protein
MICRAFRFGKDGLGLLQAAAAFLVKFVGQQNCFK